MTATSPPTITQLLVAWNQGDQGALEQLTPLVYRELHRLAKGYLAGERPDHVLQTTALVNEAFVRLIDWRSVEWQNRAHFFGVAAILMRHILVQFAREQQAAKRGGGPAIHVTLSEAAGVELGQHPDLIALDDALTDLERLNPRHCFIAKEDTPQQTIRFFSFATRRITPLITTNGEALFWQSGLALSSDSKRLLFAQPEPRKDEIMLMENFH